MIKYEGYINRSYFSRYGNDRIINDGVNLFYEYHYKINIDNIRYIEHVVTVAEEYKWTKLAQDYYDNPLYWWMLAVINGVVDPFDGPIRNTIIKIPYKDDIVLLYNKVIK